MTLIFEGPVDLEATPGVWGKIEPEIGSAFYFSNLELAMGGVCAGVTSVTAGSAPIDPAVSNSGDMPLRLRQPGRIAVRVAGRGPNGPCAVPIWNGVVSAGQAGVEYDLPIPRAALFGKQAFAMSVSEAGSLLSVQYGQEVGTASLLNAAGAALTAAKSDTAAQQAADLKSEADLIFQQQRLALCKAKPSECK